MVRTIVKVLTVTLITLLLVTLLPVIASAYPTGYTSDNSIGVGGLVDIDSRSNVVHIAYTDVSGTVTYRRSTDQGVTWSTPVNFGAANAGMYPVLTVTSVGIVYLAYCNSTATQINIQRSLDNGVTWEPNPYATLTVTHISSLAITKNTDNPAVCFQHNNSFGNPDVYWSVVTAGTMTESKASHDRSSDSNRNPRIASDGSRYIVIWECSDSLNQDIGIWYRWSDAGTDAELDGNSSGSLYQNPDVVFGGQAGTVNASYTVWDSVHHYTVYTTSYNGSAWSAANPIMTNLDNRPTSRVVPVAGGTVIRRGGVTDVQLIGSSTVTLYQSTNNDPPVSASRDSNNGATYFAIWDGGHIVIKRSDTVAPTGSTIQAPTFVNGQTFELTFAGVVDDWNVTDATGATNNGTPYWNGVVSVQPQWGMSEHGSFFNLGSLLTTSPWTATVDASGFSDGVLFLRGQMTDTAGNVGYSQGAAVIIDRAPPTANVTTDTTPNASGWRKATGFTVSGSDSISGIDHCDYKIGSGNWTRCQGRVAAPNGSYDVGYRAIDVAGNSSGENQHIHLNVDKTTPTITIDKPAGTTWTADKTNHADVHAIGSDSISGVVWMGIYLHGQKVAEANSDHVTGHLDVSGYTNGLHTLQATGIDAAGNTTSTTRTVQLVKAGPAHSDTYFAEGTTRPGFDEYLSILNPDTKTADLTIDYQLETGQVITKTATVNPQTRLTIHVPDQVPAGHDVSVKIHSEGASVIAERPMYFNYNGKWDGGHTAVGVNLLQRDYYFAEGTTRQNGTDGPFDTWLTLQNPNDQQANVGITYMLGSGQNIQKTYTVAAHSRYTVSVNQDVGINQDVSTKIHSDIPIACERPMYFNYHNKWTGGHDVTGVTAPAKTWDFAEGTTRPGFDEWLCIQNPNDGVANISVNYTTGDGRSIQASYRVAGHSRYTVSVNHDVGPGQDVSAEVSSDVPVIAERPMYFDYNGWTGGSDVVGSTATGPDFYFAEGTTRQGFQEYLTVLTPTSSNPTQSNSLVVSYITPDGKVITKTHEGSGRITINVNQDVGPGQDVAVHITQDPKRGSKFVVERPMYFNYNGWTGGSDVTGTPHNQI